jgi:putative transposase
VGFRFPAEVITAAVRWYLRYRLAYRDVEELLAGGCSAGSRWA